MTAQATQVETRPAWHALTIEKVVSELGTDLDTGLGVSEAALRLGRFGLNRLGEEPRWVRTKRLAHQFQDVLIWLLLVAALVSGLVLDAWVDAVAIAAIVALNSIIGYAQESKADRALLTLRELEAPTATVVRAGTVNTLDSRELVPGDIVVVDAGSRVPADGRVADAIRLVVNEAPLTGESIPVAKTEEPTPADSLLADRTSMLFAGTTVVSGRARFIVTSTGSATEMGRIASLFGSEEPVTPLQRELARVGRRLGMVALASAVLIFGAGLLRSFPLETMALTAVALAVAAIPEGLPAVVTVSLAGGLQRMAHRNAIVRRLPAVETLGAVDVICTDKTGTLTAPELQVGAVLMADGRHGLDLLSDGDGPVRSIVESMALCNDVYRTPDGLTGDPTEVALLTALTEAGFDFETIRHLSPRIDEAGFDGRRKRMSTVHADEVGFLLRTKGAPEVLIARSSTLIIGNGVEVMTPAHRKRLTEQAEHLAAAGMRTLAFATRRLEQTPDDPAEAETDLCFLGMVGLRERIRDEVPSAIRRAADAGVTTVMVTGDHATTAEAVADAVGLTRGDVMDGRTLGEMSADDLAAVIDGYRVFARVDPADKVKIIEAWKTSGATVAMTGDGVNDAPALHRADIGVAMGSGTDVARESAAMVLTDDNYATIVSAIAEGRRMFNNLRNVVHYLLSANVSEVLYVLTGFLVFGFLGEPLLAVQILWINLLSDALPAIALGMESPGRDLMKDRPGQGRDVLSGRNIAMLLTQGVILAIAALAAMLVGTYHLDLGQDAVRTMVFSTLVFSQLLHALNVRAGSVRLRRPGRLLMTAVVGSALLQLVVLYTTLGNDVFRTVALDLPALGWVVAASAASMLLVRVFNVWFERRRARR